jgi:hypothetical protein
MKHTIKLYTIPKTLTAQEWMFEINVQPEMCIAQNSKLQKTGFWQWSIPAFVTSVVRNGKLVPMMTCPAAGDCAKACYACQGTFMFKSSMIAHARNLQFYLNSPETLKAQLIKELSGRRNLRAFRVHDSGDFFNKEYALWWFDIMNSLPDIKFYAYTKQVHMFKNVLKGQIPKNFTIVFSYGGKLDHLIDPKKDRHSRVFSSLKELKAARYWDTTEDDENAAIKHRRKIGLVYHGVASQKTVGFMELKFGQVLTPV